MGINLQTYINMLNEELEVIREETIRLPWRKSSLKKYGHDAPTMAPRWEVNPMF